jgi:hypothetical protein
LRRLNFPPVKKHVPYGIIVRTGESFVDTIDAWGQGVGNIPDDSGVPAAYQAATVERLHAVSCTVDH